MHLRFKKLILLFLMIMSCATTNHKEFRTEIAKVYGESSPGDKEDILFLFNYLVNAIVDEDMSRILPHIHSDLGIWVDLKSEWTKKEFEKDLEKPLGYINMYFLSTDKLREQKNSKTAKSVKDILLKSQGYYLDFYFDEDNGECELDIKFRKERKYENDLIHPVFKKVNGRWYIYRLL